MVFSTLWLVGEFLGRGARKRHLALRDARCRRLRVEALEARNLLSAGAAGTPLSLAALEGGDAGAAIYANDFEGAVGPEWSSTLVDVTPLGARRFLGQFGTETVTLTLPAALVPAGTKALSLSFDLFVIRSWDGNHTGSGSGPDRWGVWLGNGVSLLDTTFSNNVPGSGSAGQAYPGPFGSGQYDPHTGADEIGTLGYEFAGSTDSVYNLHFTFTYTGGDVVLQFDGDLTTPGIDESWGLDNVQVTAISDASSAPKDFVLSNPNGVWSYGWIGELGDQPLVPYPDLSTFSDGTQYMTDESIQSLQAPSVTYNPTASPTLSANFPLLPGQLGMHPGPNLEWSVVRWTAPAEENVTIAALFTGRDVTPTTTDVHVLHNGFELFAGSINRFRVGPYFETTLDVHAGDTIDFAVGDGGNGFLADSSALDAVIISNSVPPPPPPPTFQFTAPQYEVSEGEQFAVVQVERTGGLGQSARVDWTTVDGTATSGGLLTPRLLSDYYTSSGTLVFRAFQSLAELRIPIRDDSRIEPDEMFQVVLRDPSAGSQLGDRSAAQVVIHDNDPSVSFLVPFSNRPESIARNPIEVRLSTPSNQTVTVAYAAVGGTATFGEDYNPQNGTLVFRPGETRKFITLAIVNDSKYEGNETVVFELSAPVNAHLGANVRHSVTIVDNDPQPAPADPGATAATALEIDLATRPIQSYQEFLSRGDVDAFKVRLRGGEYLALDVDPGRGPVLPTSRLAIVDGDGTTVLATVGASAEPETGVVTPNPAYLFQADADGGTYYVALWTTAAGPLFGYTLHFYRIGVSEKVPAPELLNAPGPMFAWFDGQDTVGITGPTGYGFTLEGPWQQQTTFSRRTGLTSQTLTLPAGAQFTLRSPQGVALPLLANSPITFSTRPQRWGDRFGMVSTPAINFPVALGIAPINDLLAEVFGSQIVAAGLLSGQWRISLGGSILAGDRGDTSSPIGPLLAGIPYLRQKGPINVAAQLGSFSFDYSVLATPIDWVFDPADPMLYLKAQEVGQVKQPALAISMHGLLEYQPQDAPAPQVDAGVTHFFGQVLASATVPFKVGPLPLEVDAEAIINVDANRDGAPLGGLRSIDQVFDILGGDTSAVRDLLHDVQFGANGRLNAVFEDFGFEMELGRASVVLNGLEETIWVRGQQGGTNPLAGTPLEKLNTANTIVLEGMINWDGDFFLSTTTTSQLAGVGLTYNITITNEGISARITGSAQWSVQFNYGVGQVSGRAIAQIEAEVAIQIDDNGELHLSGAVSATGKLRFNGNTVFSGTIDASVRSRGFRFRFPRGVGNLDLNLF